MPIESLSFPGEEVPAPGPASDRGLVEGVRELLRIQAEIGSWLPEPAVALTADEIAGRLDACVPLLSLHDFYPDWERAQPALRRITDWASTGNTDIAREAKRLDSVTFGKLAEVWYGGSGATEGDQSGLVVLVGACLKPFLQVRSRQLVSVVDHDRWRRRLCPVCGGRPDFGYLAREDGARWLMCSRCDAVWLYHRLKCPSCETEDQSRISYFADSSERYRLYVCDACRGYIKIIDLRKAPLDTDLGFERFLTVELDREAGKNRYLP
jgi:hypothetical protein